MVKKKRTSQVLQCIFNASEFAVALHGLAELNWE